MVFLLISFEESDLFYHAGQLASRLGLARTGHPGRSNHAGSGTVIGRIVVDAAAVECEDKNNNGADAVLSLLARRELPGTDGG